MANARRGDLGTEMWGSSRGKTGLNLGDIARKGIEKEPGISKFQLFAKNARIKCQFLIPFFRFLSAVRVPEPHPHRCQAGQEEAVGLRDPRLPSKVQALQIPGEFPSYNSICG